MNTLFSELYSSLWGHSFYFPKGTPSLYIIICSIFTQEEVNEIRALKLSDIIKQVTSIAENDIQEDVFEWNTGDPCRQPLQLNASHLEHCPYLKGHDYFQVRKKMKKFSYYFLLPKKVLKKGKKKNRFC